jgi:hypothetical protein
MPRTVTNIVPDPTPTTAGVAIHVRRRPNGKTIVELEGTGDPDGAYEVDAASLPAAVQTALTTFAQGLIADFKVKRGY